MTNNTINTTPSPLVKKFLDEVAEKQLKIVLKSQSKLMKFLGFFAKIFNPKFMEYHTTIGTTVYVADSFFTTLTPVGALQIIIHENIHAKDYLRNKAGFPLGYLFPQVVAIPAAVLLVCLTHWWIGLLVGLLFLTPAIPAVFRYQDELRAYRTLLLFSKYVYPNSPATEISYKNFIFEQLTGKWYLYAMPYPSKVRKDLDDMTYATQPDYVPLVAFLQRYVGARS